MKRVQTVAASVALLSAGLFSTAAQAEVTGNIGVASQYMFRGVSFGDPQVSGGLDWSHSSGLYAGGWVSSAGGEQEVDLYGGWANDLIDVGYLYYYFPKAESEGGTADAAEVYAGVASGPFAAKVSYAPSGASGGEDDDWLYAEASLDIALTEKATLSLHVGLFELTGKAYDNDPETSFVDYSATVSFGDLFVMLSSTDFDASELGFTSGQLKGDPTITVGYGWSFDGLM